MGKKTLTRRVVLGVAFITTRCNWAESQLVVSDYSKNREVRLNIRSPDDVAYIREKLKEIEDCWRGQLETLR